MLGEIAFDPWQCIAELVDNSLDAYFSAIGESEDWLDEMGLPKFGIDIQLPNRQDFDLGVGSVRVSDTGPGMDLEQLTNAVRAGFSGNAPLEKLGLFGMGFNIATARLGRMTRIMTTKPGDTNWLVLQLDLDEMQKSGEFNASISYETKDDDDHHGTVVEIARLKSEFRGLTSGPSRGSIKKQLSRIYSAILNEEQVEIKFCDNELEPWKHCVWGKERTAVVGSGTHVPAFIEIDHPLPDYFFCSVCWHWSIPSSVKSEGVCPACGAEDSIELKPRQITGWLGIQRYFDQSHYGIDFIRNGRIIEQLNKDCFVWDHDGEEELEYPIDTTHWGGRIVGQINIDFAQVDYQKTSFAKNRNEWKEVLDYLRGSSPLRPQIAEERKYAENDSPIFRLFRTFRSGRTPGRRMLVPGQYNNLLKGDNADATQWAEYFFKGEPEFQTDEKWWNRVMQAENARRGNAEDAQDTDDEDVDLEDPFAEDHEEGEDDSEAGEEEEDYRVPDKDLSRRYSFPDPNVQLAPVEVTVFRDIRDLRARDLKNQPPFEVDNRQAPHRYSLTYHPKHPAFVEFAETPQDYLLIEIAHWLSTRQGGGTWTAGRVYKALKDEHQRAQKLDLQSLGASAAELLGELKEHLADCGIKKERSEVPQKMLDELTSDVMSAEGNVEHVDVLLESGKWVERVSEEYMLHEIEEHPELVMDGRFLNTSYDAISQENIKKDTVDRVASCIRDVIMIKKTSDRLSMPDKSLLLRANAAINYLIQQRA
jgi:hypothetical protein